MKLKYSAGKPTPHTRAVRTLRKFSISVAERLESIGCDPITLLALYALGDVVTLGLMTKQEYAAEAELVEKNGLSFVIRKSGMARAAEAIPPGLRAKCAMELAQYVFPKRSSVSVVNPDGTPLSMNPNPSQVIVMMPDNGRKIAK